MPDLGWLLSVIPETTDGVGKLIFWSACMLSIGVIGGLWISGQRLENSRSEKENLQSRIAPREDEITKLKDALTAASEENARLQKESFKELRHEVEDAETDASKTAALVDLVDALTSRIDKLEEPSEWQKMLMEMERIQELEKDGPEVRRVMVEALPGQYARGLTKVPDNMVRSRPHENAVVMGASNPKQEQILNELVDHWQQERYIITELEPENPVK